MIIDVEPKDLGPVVQLVAKDRGWKPEEIRFKLDSSIYIGGNPDSSVPNYTPDCLKDALRAAWLTTEARRPNDYNGLKVGVRSLAVIDGILSTEAIITDYFTAWGLPKSDASRNLFKDHEQHVVINRAAVSGNAIYQTDVPWAVCSHNILIDRNGDLLMMVRSQSQGFNAGRVSVTEEEQMEPTLDFSPFNTAFRSFHEELDLVVPPQSIRLLGVALEKGAAYPAYCFIAETEEASAGIVAKWRKARDYNEHTALFVVGMADIKKWLASEEITSSIWHTNLLAGEISPDARLKFHATSPWRIGLTERYTQSV